MGVHSDEYWYIRISMIISFHHEIVHLVLDTDTPYTEFEYWSNYH
jgi:hypothetical protein